MTTSGTYTFSPSVGDVINDVLDTLRITQEGVNASAYDIAKVTRRLDYILKAWVDQGIPIWSKFAYTVPIVTNKAQYSVGPGMDIVTPPLVDILNVRYVYSTGEYIVLTKISRMDYQNYSLPASQGVPNSYYLDNQLGKILLNLYPVPQDTADSLFIDTQRYLQDAGATTNTLDLPVQWARALMWNTCQELLSSYEQPTERVQYIMKMAMDSLDLARSGAGESADLFIYPDCRFESDQYTGS